MPKDEVLRPEGPKIEAQRTSILRPEGPKIEGQRARRGGGILERGQSAPSPPAKGLGER